ncbi:hypothetical protein FB451DRAFT_1189770 [Mycena latifolia]|nr:hypothetical protein FB451DRAFT_1189770 [Mycena latifolia]
MDEQWIYIHNSEARSGLIRSGMMLVRQIRDPPPDHSLPDDNGDQTFKGICLSCLSSVDEHPGYHPPLHGQIIGFDVCNIRWEYVGYTMTFRDSLHENMRIPSLFPLSRCSKEMRPAFELQFGKDRKWTDGLIDKERKYNVVLEYAVRGGNQAEDLVDAENHQRARYIHRAPSAPALHLQLYAKRAQSAFLRLRTPALASARPVFLDSGGSDSRGGRTRSVSPLSSLCSIHAHPTQYNRSAAPAALRSSTEICARMTQFTAETRQRRCSTRSSSLRRYPRRHRRHSLRVTAKTLHTPRLRIRGDTRTAEYILEEWEWDSPIPLSEQWIVGLTLCDSGVTARNTSALHRINGIASLLLQDSTTGGALPVHCTVGTFVILGVAGCRGEDAGGIGRAGKGSAELECSVKWNTGASSKSRRKSPILRVSSGVGVKEVEIGAQKKLSRRHNWLVYCWSIALLIALGVGLGNPTPTLLVDTPYRPGRHADNRRRTSEHLAAAAGVATPSIEHASSRRHPTHSETERTPRTRGLRATGGSTGSRATLRKRGGAKAYAASEEHDPCRAYSRRIPALARRAVRLGVRPPADEGQEEGSGQEHDRSRAYSSHIPAATLKAVQLHSASGALDIRPPLSTAYKTHPARRVRYVEWVPSSYALLVSATPNWVALPVEFGDCDFFLDGRRRLIPAFSGPFTYSPSFDYSRPFDYSKAAVRRPWTSRSSPNNYRRLGGMRNSARTLPRIKALSLVAGKVLFILSNHKMKKISDQASSGDTSGDEVCTGSISSPELIGDGVQRPCSRLRTYLAIDASDLSRSLSSDSIRNQRLRHASVQWASGTILQKSRQRQGFSGRPFRNSSVLGLVMEILVRLGLTNGTNFGAQCLRALLKIVGVPPACPGANLIASALYTSRRL